jgi:thiamine-phosphate pyrophosphorylase
MTAMSQPLTLPPLYAIFDPEQTQGRAPDVVFRELMAGGAKMLQLRVKQMTPRDFLQLAKQARDPTRASSCGLIINDRVDVALACGADGVHLGQEDLPLAPARELVGKKIVGLSTHTVAQALAAEQAGADYIGFGPIFSTMTKDTGYTARGVAMLRQVREAVKIPIVAIGGINEANVTEVWQGGADSAAIISDILRAEDVTAKVRSILARHHPFGQHS